MKIVNPSDVHKFTVILLHGLGSNSSSVFNDWGHLFNNNSKLIFLQAPVKFVTCYQSKMRSWHDYFTDNSKKLEEDLIDNEDLNRTREYIHRIIEMEKVPYDSIFLWGQSQGACCAIDAALSFKCEIGGVFMSFGMLYSITPIRSRSPIFAFHGTKDSIIPYALFKKSMRRINFTENISPVEHTEWTLNEEQFLRASFSLVT